MEKPKDLIRQALARGYCTKRNERKYLDANLIEDMAIEIEKYHKALIKEMTDEIEQLRVQLAGCGVAALGYAKGKNDCKKGDYGWSQSFEDVKNLWNKYIVLTKKLKGAK